MVRPIIITAVAIAAVTGSVLAGGCGSKSAEPESSPAPSAQQIQQIQNNPNMPAQAKAAELQQMQPPVRPSQGTPASGQ